MATRQAASTGERRRVLLSLAALLVGLAGLAALAGGLLLIALGGSWYYALAGVVMLAVAALLWLRRPIALHLFALLVLGTLIWAVAEIGFDFWQLVPRGDIVFLLGVLLATPWIARQLSPHGRWRTTAGPLAGALVVAALVGIVSLVPDPGNWDGGLPGARAAAPARQNGMPAGDWFAYGGDWRGTKWSPLTQITPGNVAKLDVAWRFETGDRKRASDPVETTY